MTMQYYETHEGRLKKMAGEILGHAVATEVLVPACRNLDMPKNKSDTIVYRSWVPFGGTVAEPNKWSITAESHITQEGITPDADTIVPRDVTFRLNQYMCLYAFTDKTADLYEDDIPAAMKEQVGERMGLVREMAIYGKMKASTNKFYAGGNSRATVDEGITEKLISKVVRSLYDNHGMKITKILEPSSDFATTPVEASFVAYVHTDAAYDIRRLPGFVETAAYGQRKLISPHELGKWQDVRFVVSADLKPYTDAGATASGTGLKTSGTKVDVYPMIVLAKEAFAQLKLRGQDALTAIYVPVEKQDKMDPGGQRGYIGAKFWHDSEILNNGWICVVETGVDDLA